MVRCRLGGPVRASHVRHGLKTLLSAHIRQVYMAIPNASPTRHCMQACEMFILELTLRSWNHAEENKRRTLQRNDIAAAITKTDIFDFLVRAHACSLRLDACALVRMPPEHLVKARGKRLRRIQPTGNQLAGFTSAQAQVWGSSLPS